MSFAKEDVDRMVDLLQSYKENLTYSSDVKLQDSLKRVIEMCQSDLFGALLGELKPLHSIRLVITCEMFHV